MNMISEQIKRLRDYAKDKRGEIADITNEAADTIEALAKKAGYIIPTEDGTIFIDVQDVEAIHRAIVQHGVHCKCLYEEDIEE